MIDFLTIAQVIISVVLIVLILLQKKGEGLFGTEARLYQTLRGAEKTIFIITLVLAFLFIVLALLNLIF